MSGRVANVIEKQSVQQGDRTVRLGEVVQQLMDSRISPRCSRFGGVAEAWSQLLPAELAQHCEVNDISGGILRVQVDSSAYKSELQWCSEELVNQLRQQCPQARIKKIKFTLA
jgi:hypothetical protein